MTNLLNELDRNMDSVYDALYVLNSAMAAIVQALPADTAAPVTQSLDRCIDALNEGQNRLDESARQTLFGWRNMAATRAGVPARLP